MSREGNHFDHSHRNQKRRRENDDFIDPSCDKCPICQQYIPLIGMVPHLKNCIIEYERKYNLPHTCPCSHQEKQSFLLQPSSTLMQSAPTSTHSTPAAIQQPISMVSNHPSPSPPNYPSKRHSPPAQYSSTNGALDSLPSRNERTPMPSSSPSPPPSPPPPPPPSPPVPLKTNSTPSLIMRAPSSTPIANDTSHSALPKFQFKVKIGPDGNENFQFKCPYFVACDRRSNIYVSDSFNHRIQMFNINGQFIRSIGTKGTEMGQFREPNGIVVNSKNHLIVADHFNCRIQIFDENMKFLKWFNSVADGSRKVEYPGGVAVDAEDNIYVVDCNHCIQVFNREGVWKKTFGRKGSGDGEFNSPWAVAVRKSDGRIFVSDLYLHSIQAFNPEGQFLFKFGSRGRFDAQFNLPRGLAVSNCGNYVFVCDCNNQRIQIFSAEDGSYIKCYGSSGTGNGQFKGPCGICISPLGYVVISETGGHRVQVFE
jgi:DNA-binding beta-propeller fold protein YncE